LVEILLFHVNRLNRLHTFIFTGAEAMPGHNLANGTEGPPAAGHGQVQRLVPTCNQWVFAEIRAVSSTSRPAVVASAI
jgi:hypothetical protein